MEITSLQLVTAIIKVCIPLFNPKRSTLRPSSIVITTLGEIAVITRLFFYYSYMYIYPFNTYHFHIYTYYKYFVAL